MECKECTMDITGEHFDGVCARCYRAALGLNLLDPPQQKRVYISGPITGMEDGNRRAFEQAALLLSSALWEVVNPHEVGAALTMPSPTWEDYMKADIAQLCTCDAIYMLPGWRKSRGAIIELGLALNLGMEVLHAQL